LDFTPASTSREYSQGISQGSSAFEFFGDGTDRGCEAAPVQVLGDQLQAMFDGQTSSGQLGQLLVESEKFARSQRAGDSLCVDRLDRNDSQAQ
jgi:hypothetical protein